jgi:hypothetical protein
VSCTEGVARSERLAPFAKSLPFPTSARLEACKRVAIQHDTSDRPGKTSLHRSTWNSFQQVVPRGTSLPQPAEPFVAIIRPHNQLSPGSKLACRLDV